MCVLFSVCVRGLGVEDGNITNSMLSASSSLSGKGPDKGRLNGNSCWMPSSSGLKILVFPHPGNILNKCKV